MWIRTKALSLLSTRFIREFFVKQDEESNYFNIIALSDRNVNHIISTHKNMQEANNKLKWYENKLNDIDPTKKQPLEKTYEGEYTEG